MKGEESELFGVCLLEFGRVIDEHLPSNSDVETRLTVADALIVLGFEIAKKTLDGKIENALVHVSGVVNICATGKPI
jgi:hypothetical protein